MAWCAAAQSSDLSLQLRNVIACFEANGEQVSRSHTSGLFCS